MKNDNSTEDTLHAIRRMILDLPADDQRTAIEHLLIFLLTIREEQPGNGASAGVPATTGLTPDQQNLINALAEHTRNLRDQAGDDLYFFM